MSWIIPVIAVLAAAYVFWWNHFENKSPESENNENLIAKAQSIMDRSVFKRRGLFIRPMIINQNFQIDRKSTRLNSSRPPARMLKNQTSTLRMDQMNRKHRLNHQPMMRIRNGINEVKNAQIRHDSELPD